MLQEGNVLVDSDALQFILKNDNENVGEYSRPFWEQELIDGKECHNCNHQLQSIEEVFIVSKCGHWICYGCLFKKICYSQNHCTKCHIDNIDISSSFYHLCLVQPAPKDLTEDDFEMVKTNDYP
ncbi:hypothetical protein NEFER03_2258 [Nematocida sp. LUAm3]|nr:hypothetical protein NEFER03_2258 [Nematocida sp. LUAm3]